MEGASRKNVDALSFAADLGDPLSALIADYRKQADWLNANGKDEFTPEYKVMDEAIAITMTRMATAAPAPITLACVAAAIRYALEEDALIDDTATGPPRLP